MTVDVQGLLASVDIVAITGHYSELRKQGGEYVGRCLWHSPDAKPSMYVVPKKRMVYCFACGEGGNAIDVVMQAEGLDFLAACARLNGGAPAEGWKPRMAAEPEKPKPERITLKPTEPAPDKAFVHFEFGAPDAILPFRDAAGDVLGYECRWKREAGKESRVLTFGQRGEDRPKWGWGHFNAPRPMFGLDQLAARENAQVLVFEGPIKARDAQEVLPNHACVGWSGGARSWHRTDWAPLKGRDVICWPDNDPPGLEAVAALGILLSDQRGVAATRVRWIDPNRQPDGWDVRDALAEGWDAGRILAFAKERVRPINAASQDSEPVRAGTGVWSPVDSPADAAPSSGGSPELPDAEASGAQATLSVASVSPSPGQASQQPGEPPTLPESASDAADEALASTVPSTQAGAASPQRKRRPALAVVGGSEGNAARNPDPDGAPAPFPLSPDALADSFAEQHRDDWRYVNEWSRWLYWAGDTWRPDKTDLCFQRVRETCRSACYWAEAAASTAKEKRALTYRSYIGGVQHLAGRDRRIASEVEDWDAEPFLLGVPGGVIDLQVGKLIEGAREQLISRRAGVAPEPGPCPTWRAVLARATRGDDSLESYLQRLAGYVSTGDTREEVFFFVYGPGASGKSTFARVLMEVLGDYSQAASVEAFMHRDRQEHMTELARMSGARLITATETDEGAKLNEARIKVLTGRDRISARFMRGDMFDFTPTAKILLVGNHKPQLRSVGEEMRRRIHLIEFPETIPEEERDKSLADKLRAEYPQILAWMVQGAALWLDAGLGRPEAVEQATKEYLAGEDTLGAWIEDCCEQNPNDKLQSGAAYKSYSRWAENRGEYVLSQKRLIQRLEDRGFGRWRSAQGRYIVGLRLRDDAMLP